jgi:hypothetical protein
MALWNAATTGAGYDASTNTATLSPSISSPAWKTSFFFYNASDGDNNLESQNIFWSDGAKF